MVSCSPNHSRGCFPRQGPSGVWSSDTQGQTNKSSPDNRLAVRVCEPACRLLLGLPDGDPPAPSSSRTDGEAPCPLHSGIVSPALILAAVFFLHPASCPRTCSLLVRFSSVLCPGGLRACVLSRLPSSGWAWKQGDSRGLSHPPPPRGRWHGVLGPGPALDTCCLPPAPLTQATAWRPSKAPDLLASGDRSSPQSSYCHCPAFPHRATEQQPGSLQGGQSPWAQPGDGKSTDAPAREPGELVTEGHAPGHLFTTRQEGGHSKETAERPRPWRWEPADSVIPHGCWVFLCPQTLVAVNMKLMTTIQPQSSTPARAPSPSDVGGVVDPQTLHTACSPACGRSFRDRL